MPGNPLIPFPYGDSELVAGLLPIVAIGDVFIAGQIPVALTVGEDENDRIGLFGLSAPKDQDWDGLNHARNPFRADNAINVATGSTDAACIDGANRGQASNHNMILDILRRAYPLQLDKIRVANLGIPGSSSYSWANEASTAQITIGAGLAAGDTITVGAVVYHWVAGGPANPNEVDIGGSIAESQQNLVNALNAQSTGWGPGTVPNPSAWIPDGPGAAGVLILRGRTNTVFALAVTGGHIVINSAPVAGLAQSALLTNGLALLGSNFASPKIIMIGLGYGDAFNDSRGYMFQASMLSLLTQLEALYPYAQIIMRKPSKVRDATAATALTTVINPAIDTLVSLSPSSRFSIDASDMGLGAVGDSTADAPAKVVSSATSSRLTHLGWQYDAQLWARQIAICLDLGVTN